MLCYNGCIAPLTGGYSEALSAWQISEKKLQIMSIIIITAIISIVTIISAVSPSSWKAQRLYSRSRMKQWLYLLLIISPERIALYKTNYNFKLCTNYTEVFVKRWWRRDAIVSPDSSDARLRPDAENPPGRCSSPPVLRPTVTRTEGSNCLLFSQDLARQSDRHTYRQRTSGLVFCVMRMEVNFDLWCQHYSSW